MVARKYSYESKVFKEGSVFEWDIEKYPKMTAAVEKVGSDIKEVIPVEKKQETMTLNEMAKKNTPKVSTPNRGKQWQVK